MLFGRKNPFSATDAFPLSDAVMEFDDSSSAMVRPARRALDSFGARPQPSSRQEWLATGALISLYTLALVVFWSLGMVDAETVGVLAAMIAAGCAVFWVVLYSVGLILFVVI